MITTRNNRLLGAIGMISGPFLLIGFYLESQFKSLEHSWFTGVWGLLYMLGWMMSLVGLERMEATGQSRFGRLILKLALGALLVANLSNVWQIIAPGHKPPFFFVLDSFWPISNVLMLPVGVMVIKAKRLPGWKRYVPLAVGLWLLVCIVSMTCMGRTDGSFLIGGGYSAIAWFLLGYIVYAHQEVSDKSMPTVPV